MSKLTILTVPREENRLRLKSKELKAEEIMKIENQNFFKALEKKMRQTDGAGLAAPQVGYLTRVIVINLNPTEQGDKSLIMINPIITKKSWLENTTAEGCLSLPGIWGEVRRPNNLTAVYLDINGKEKTIKGGSYISRVISHEIDHLDGILFIDKAKNITKKI